MESADCGSGTSDGGTGITGDWHQGPRNPALTLGEAQIKPQLAAAPFSWWNQDLFLANECAKGISICSVYNSALVMCTQHSPICFFSHMDALFHPLSPPSTSLTPTSGQSNTHQLQDSLTPCSRDKEVSILKTLTSPARPNYDQQPLNVSVYENPYAVS